MLYADPNPIRSIRRAGGKANTAPNSDRPMIAAHFKSPRRSGGRQPKKKTVQENPTGARPVSPRLFSRFARVDAMTEISLGKRDVETLQYAPALYFVHGTYPFKFPAVKTEISLSFPTSLSFPAAPLYRPHHHGSVTVPKLEGECSSLLSARELTSRIHELQTASPSPVCRTKPGRRLGGLSAPGRTGQAASSVPGAPLIRAPCAGSQYGRMDHPVRRTGPVRSGRGRVSFQGEVCGTEHLGPEAHSKIIRPTINRSNRAPEGRGSLPDPLESSAAGPPAWGTSEPAEGNPRQFVKS